MEHLLAVLPRIPVVAAAEEILMTGNVPSNYTPYPDYSWVEQANSIQDGVNAAREANEISDEIARQIGHVAIQGTSQPR